MRPIATALMAYLVALAGIVGLSFLAVSVVFPPGSPGRLLESLPVVLLGGLVSSTVLLVVAIAATEKPRAPRLRLLAGRASIPAVLVMIVGVLSLGQALESLAFVLGVGESGSMGVFRRALRGVTGLDLFRAVVVIGIVAAFGEELFFRGFMQTRLRERWKPRAAVTVTALAFGVLHIEPVHAVLAFVLGLYLGFVTEASGSIRASIACHVANNTVATVLTARFGTVTGFWDHVLLLSVTTAVFIVSLIMLRSMLPAPAIDGPALAV